MKYEDVRFLNSEAARLHDEFHTCAVRLANAVTLARHESGNIQDLFGEKISNYMEAYERYTAAVDEAIAACERLSKRIRNSR